MERREYLDTIKQHLQTAYLLSEERSEVMIPVFLATLRSHMNRLAELATEGDMELLGRTAHAVKGALLNIGLADLAEAAHAIERHCKASADGFDYHGAITDLQYTISLLCNE